jgi:hypothetical protein
VWRLRVETAPSLEETLNDKECAPHRTFADMVSAKIERTNRVNDPGYRGTQAAVDPRLRWMLEPFDARRVPRVE